MTDGEPLSGLDSKIIDNYAGFVPDEESGSLQEVIGEYCHYASSELSEPIYRMDIGSGFVFLSGFEESSEAFQSLLDAGVLADQGVDDWGTSAPIRVVMGRETDQHTKEVLLDLVRGNLSDYDSDVASLLGELLENDLLEIRVIEDNRFHAKIFNFYLTGSPFPDDTWNGSANFTKSGLSNNIELSLPVQTTFESRRSIRRWFDALWNSANDDLDVLQVLNEVEESQSVYYSPHTFFAAVIAALDKDYLLEDAPGATTERLLNFQDFSYRIVMSRLESYGGYILANSVGTGKTYVGAQVAKTYLRSRRIGPTVEGRVLAVVPNAVIEDWAETLEDFGIQNDVDVVSMGEFQKTHRSEDTTSTQTFDERQYSEEYRLIIVDEAHNYRNDSNRRNNLERVIRANPEARVLLLSATPINLSPNDLFQLIDLFRNGNRQALFQKNELHQHYVETRAKFKQLDNYEHFSRNLLNDIRLIEQELSLKLTWRILADEYEEDIRAIGGQDVAYKEPEVDEISYSYPTSYQSNIFDQIVPFLNDLNYESAKLVMVGDGSYNPDVNVIFFRKWRLYKQLESSVVAFHRGLKNLRNRTQLYLNSLENQEALGTGQVDELVDSLPEPDSVTLQGADIDRLDRLVLAYEELDEETQSGIRRRMNEDLERIDQMIARVEQCAGDESKIPRDDDTKVDQFISIIESEVSQDNPVLVFSEFVSTVEYLGEVLNECTNISVRTIHGQTGQSKEAFVEAFQNGEFDVAITTELLAEGVNLPRADVVINYDLPYNPTALIQRTGRALRITNPKQVSVKNFTPEDSIDRELELYDRLDARLENIVQIAGLDFVIWLMDDEQIEQMRSQEQEEYLQHLQEYKESIGSKSPEETIDESLPARDKIDVVLERAIDEYGIETSLIEEVPIPHSKPIYTVLDSDDPGELGVIGEIGGTVSVWKQFQRTVNSASSTPSLTDSNWAEIDSLIEERKETIMREQTVQGTLNQRREIHDLVRSAHDRLTRQNMRGVMTDILSGIENNIFRTSEEETIEEACQMILNYPDMVRDIDEQVLQRDGWQQLEQLSNRTGSVGSGEGIEIRPIAIAKYIDGN